MPRNRPNGGGNRSGVPSPVRDGMEGSGEGGSEIAEAIRALTTEEGARKRELDELVAKAYREAAHFGNGDEELTRAWQFFLLHNAERGVFGRRAGNPFKMSRREWMERHIMIEDKGTRVMPFKLNQSQRNLEAIILRMERAGAPVRVVILKVRQNGISTYDLAFMVWLICTRTNVKARVITDREDLCGTLLNRVKRMFSRMHKSDGSLWNLPTDKSNRDTIVLGEPFWSSIAVVSANTPSPGYGETNTCVDMEETSKWPDAEEKGKGVELTLPEISGSYAFDVSQPKGNSGYFAKKFKRAWYRLKGMADPSASDEDIEKSGAVDGLLGAGGWRPLFIPWFLHEEYRWTRLGSNPPVLPDKVRDAIEQTLTDEERVLLQQKYLLHGKGWCNVDYDQLAWRRFYIPEKCNGSIDTFHEQCPAFPEEAFLASGRPAFNIEALKRMQARYQRAPLRKVRMLHDGTLDDDRNGELWVWSMPEPEEQYAIGVDTAAGVRGGDPCVMTVTNVVTRAIVAEWYGWEPPHSLGVLIKRLSDLYRADVAIETHPSQHGLATYNVAEQAGCERLFVQQRVESREEGFEVRKGWAMSQQAKALIMDLVAVAIRDQCDVPSQRTLQELLDAQLDDKEKVDRACRNDLITAYGLSLALAERCRVERRVKPKPKPLPPTGSDEAFWRDRKARQGIMVGPDGTRRRAYDRLNGEGL